MKRSKMITLVLIASVSMTAHASDLSDNKEYGIMKLGEPSNTPTISDTSNHSENNDLLFYLLYWHLLTSKDRHPVIQNKSVSPTKSHIAKSNTKPISRGGFGKSASAKFSVGA